MGLGFTQFDIIVLILLMASAAIGFFRGAVLELVSLFALIVAAGAAIFSLSSTAPIARHMIHIDWLATALALIVVFVLVFGIIRMVGAIVARQIQQTDFLGFLDRSLGLFIGLARGLLVLGALNLMFNAATPEDMRPHWIVGSSTWPLSQTMGKLLVVMAPSGMDIAGRLKPAFDRALHNAKHDAMDDRLKSEGYDARQRGEIEGLVEKSR